MTTTAAFMPDTAPLPSSPGWYRSWRYVEAGGRDLRLDFLRGYALVAMFINHLRGDSWLYVLSGHEQFYTSAADAFYCISGLVLGIVAARQTFATAVQRVLRRTVQIYCVALLIGLGFTALGVLRRRIERAAAWTAAVSPLLSER